MSLKTKHIYGFNRWYGVIGKNNKLFLFIWSTGYTLHAWKNIMFLMRINKIEGNNIKGTCNIFFVCVIVHYIYSGVNEYCSLVKWFVVCKILIKINISYYSYSKYGFLNFVLKSVLRIILTWIHINISYKMCHDDTESKNVVWLNW